MDSYSHPPSVAPSMSNGSPTELFNGLGPDIPNQPPHSTPVPSVSGAVDARSPPNTVQAACLACVSLNTLLYIVAFVLTKYLVWTTEGKASKV